MLKPIVVEMSKENTVSASKLARLAHPEPCLRCFWLSVKVPKAEDYQIHAGALQKIDQLAKRLVERSFFLHGKAPGWLPLDCDDRWSKIGRKDFTRDWGDGMTSSGIPDDVLQLTAGGWAIVDYKSGQFKVDSPWRDVYKAQVQIYSALRPTLAVKIVGILYLQPVGKPIDEQLSLPFDPVWDFLEANEDVVEPLVDTAKECLAGPLPEARDNCRTCAALDLRAHVVNEYGAVPVR